MKKTLLLVFSVCCVVQTMFALTIEEGKFYTIKNFSSTPAYMADNEASDNRIECVAAITPSTYWQFVPTGNANCYYIKNYTTGRYIQGYSERNEMVLMGSSPVEYQVQSFDNEGGRFGFSVTTNSLHDFSSGTIGLNLHAESNQADCYAQSYDAVAGSNHRSFWTLDLVTPPMVISTSKVYVMSNGTNNDVYIKDNGENELAMGNLDNASLWQFEDAGNGQFYVKNVKTGRYAQACATTTEVAITMGDAPVAYVVVNCSDKEGKDCFGLTSADQTNVAFTDGCIGWNWRADNIVQTFAAKAGQNHRSFWKFTELEPQTITTVGYATYCANEDVIVLGAQAYKGIVSSSYVSLEEVSDVPAGSAVVLKGNLFATIVTSASSDMTGNDLIPSTGITANGTQYALANMDGKVGFYQVESSTTIPAGKAYISSGAGVKVFYFEGENAIGIEDLNVNTNLDDAIYNLAGQRINKMHNQRSTHVKGINIVGGKKVLF